MTAPSLVTVTKTTVQTEEPALRVLHYWRKAAITRSAVLGTEETPLCGMTGRTSAPMSEGIGHDGVRNVVCPLCGTLYDQMRK